MKFSEALITDINNKIYLPDILEQERGEIIPGYDFNTNCVAHKDDSPSMRVYLEKGRGAYCFSCGRSFTPYSTLKYLTGLKYTDLVERLQLNYKYTIPDDLTEDREYSIQHKEMSNKINYIRHYLNPKTLEMLNKAITVDFKNGNSKQLNKLYDIILNKYEKDVI